MSRWATGFIPSVVTIVAALPFALLGGWPTGAFLLALVGYVVPYSALIQPDLRPLLTPRRHRVVTGGLIGGVLGTIVAGSLAGDYLPLDAAALGALTWSVGLAVIALDGTVGRDGTDSTCEGEGPRSPTPEDRKKNEQTVLLLTAVVGPFIAVAGLLVSAPAWLLGVLALCWLSSVISLIRG